MSSLTQSVRIGAWLAAAECFDPDLGGVTVAVDIYSFGITVW